MSQGRIIAGKYNILKEIGRGGMGVVYKAEDTKLDRIVALKFLPPGMTKDSESRQRFVREAKAAAALNHPQICTIYEIDESDGQTFISMEYVDGPNLKDKLMSGPLKSDEVEDIGIQAAKGLLQAHKKGIIHRDIKPANIMIDQEGRAKITDFGLAKLSGGVDLTKASTIMGTIAYMSPEQAQGESVDHRSDIWALGVSLYEMLTGHLPFKGENEASMLNSLLHKEPEPLDTHLKDIHEGWQGIINKALSKDIENRYQDLQELLDDLTGLKAGLPVIQKSITPAKPKAIRIAVLAVLAVSLAAAAYLLLFRNTPAKEDQSVPSLPLRTAIAVLPFSYTGSDEHSDMNVGIVDLLSVNLDGAGDIRSVDPRTLLSFFEQEKAEAADVNFGRRVSQKYQADSFVLGAIVEAGGRYRINASLYDTEDPTQILSQAHVEGNADDLFTLVDNLTTQLIIGVAKTPQRRSMRIAAATTDSLPALKAFLEGEKEFRAGNIDLAYNAFQRAVEKDETFSLAWLRMTDIEFGFRGRREQALIAYNQAKKQFDRLPHHARLRLESWDAILEGDYTNSIQRLKKNIANYPEDLESRKELAVMMSQFGPMIGASLQEPWDILISALEYDNQDFSIYQGLAFQAAKLRKFDEMKVYINKYLELAPNLWVGEILQALVPFVTGDQAGKEMICSKADGDTPTWIRGATIYHIAVHTEPPSEALMMMPRYIDSLDDKSELSITHVFISCINMAEGKQNAALDELQVAGSIKSENQQLFGPFLSTLPLANVPRSELSKLRKNLDQWRPDPLPSTEQGGGLAGIHNDISIQIRHYLMGLLCIHLEDYDSARTYAAELQNMDSPPRAKSMIRLHANSILANIRKNEGQLKEAMKLLDQEIPKIHFPDMGYSPFYSLSALRYLRAEILYEMGQFEEALRWYESFHYSFLYDIPYRAPCYFRSGDIYEKLRRTDEAIKSYSQFVEFWKECDPELKPFVEQAEKRLESLRNQ